HSKYERTLAAALRNSGYYDISMLASEAEAERGLAQGRFLFVINIPPNFDRSVDRGETPSILVDADATDPTAIGNAAAALAALSTALDPDLPPVRPIEFMLAKIVPYVFVGYIQVVLILAVSALFFQVPVRGSVALLLFALGLFISSNLALGITYSTVAANQMQAIQFALFTLLP